MLLSMEWVTAFFDKIPKIKKSKTKNLLNNKQTIVFYVDCFMLTLNIDTNDKFIDWNRTKQNTKK